MEADDEIFKPKHNNNKGPMSEVPYKLKPCLDNAFKGIRIKRIIRKTLAEKLQGKAYNLDDVRNWTTEIADSVNMKIKERITMPNYKYVVQVMLGQQQGAGCHYFSKCCWDVDTDSQTSETFSNNTLFCVCTVFGVYLY